ncbi:MAG TPA: DUF2806 domain-containing protein [Candidatus Saccharimonadales bacterium]|nr:DUF2806 domain-containing protein [Candidatus Saccharimonadales bacterium]
MGKLAVSEKGAELEFNKDDQEFITKISKHNFFGIVGDHIAMWRWQNAAKIIERARKFAETHSISPNKIPSKFLVEFMDNASVEEEETLQDIWAKILAKESDNPETFSLRTLNILKLMNKSDAQNFSVLTKFLISHSSEIFLINDDAILKKYKIDFNNLMKLEELGLIVLNPLLSLQLDFAKIKEASFYTNRKLLMIKLKPDMAEKTLSISAYTLTTVGKQLFSVVDEGQDVSFIKDSGLKLKSENADLLVTLHEINSVDTVSGNINFQKLDILAV